MRFEVDDTARLREDVQRVHALDGIEQFRGKLCEVVSVHEAVGGYVVEFGSGELRRVFEEDLEPVATKFAMGQRVRFKQRHPHFAGQAGPVEWIGYAHGIYMVDLGLEDLPITDEKWLEAVK